MNKVCLNCQKTLIRTQRKFCSDKCFKTPRKKGYTKENTIAVSMLANRIKTDASIEQIGKVYKFYKKLLKNKIIN
jgi:hypothetical protein